MAAGRGGSPWLSFDALQVRASVVLSADTVRLPLDREDPRATENPALPARAPPASLQLAPIALKVGASSSSTALQVLHWSRKHLKHSTASIFDLYEVISKQRSVESVVHLHCPSVHSCVTPDVYPAMSEYHRWASLQERSGGGNTAASVESLLLLSTPTQFRFGRSASLSR